VLESLDSSDFTADARNMVERARMDDCFRLEFWRQLRWFALVEPCEDVVPIRAKFGKREESNPTLGWDFLTSKEPIWLTGPDVIPPKLITGKALKILKASQAVPRGVQSGLQPVTLHNHLEVDPLRDDLAVKLVELRTCLKDKTPKLAAGLKVGANSAAFGLLCQMNVKDLDSPCALHASLVTGGSPLNMYREG
jgi:hypothetical protein